MNTFVKTISIVIILILQYNAHAHDHRLISARIDHKNSLWTMTLDCSSHKFLTAMRSYYQDDQLTFNSSDKFKEQLKNYLISTVQIKVNKTEELEIENVTYQYSDHATIIKFDLLEVPGFSNFWEFMIKPGISSVHDVIMLRFSNEKQSRLMKLENRNDYRTELLKDKEGLYKFLNK